jgi:hypothetical protein
MNGIDCAPIRCETRNELLRRQTCQCVFSLQACEHLPGTVTHLQTRTVEVCRGRCVWVVDQEVDDVAMLLGHRTVRHGAGSAGTYAVAGTAYGPMAAFIPEIFATRYRYSGAGLALNLAGLVGGALPTIIAAPLLATWGVPALGAMMAIVVLVSLVCTALLPETKGAPLRRDDEPHWGAAESR